MMVVVVVVVVVLVAVMTYFCNRYRVYESKTKPSSTE
jgi:heme/copper-type cytochrome/quinol oxidase subunit 2